MQPLVIWTSTGSNDGCPEGLEGLVGVFEKLRSGKEGTGGREEEEGGTHASEIDGSSTSDPSKKRWLWGW